MDSVDSHLPELRRVGEHESDGAGLYGKHQNFAVEVEDGDFFVSIPYSSISGPITCNREGTLLKFPFRGDMQTKDSWEDTACLVEMAGKGLQEIAGQLRDGKRVQIKKGSGGKVEVVSVFIVRREEG